MYRLYVDEVGTDSLSNVHKDNHRCLSLTGVAIDCDHSREFLLPEINRLKSSVFKHDPDDPLIFHRTDILGFKGPYQILRDEAIKNDFNSGLLAILANCEYTVITALIDKQWMLQQDHWKQNHPYHYLMEILTEKYAQFLERKGQIGDIMPEARGKPHDGKLQTAFNEVRSNGTSFVSASRIQSVIRAKSLKFRRKAENIPGLQLADLIAHPSNMYVRHLMGHSVNLGDFAKLIVDILNRNKYDRSDWGKVMGYGIKHLPS